MDYLNYNLEIDNIKNFLNNIETTKYFESRLIDDLVKHSPKNIYSSNNKFKYVLRKNNYGTRTLYYVAGSYNREYPFNWRNCIKNKHNIYDPQYEINLRVRTSFREVIKLGTYGDYSRKHTIYNKDIKQRMSINGCDICGVKERGQIDHYGVFFVDILDSYIKKNNLSYNILYEKYIKFDNNIKRWTLNDPKMINEWLWFHDQLASYRILCETCNKKKENKPILEHT